MTTGQDGSQRRDSETPLSRALRQRDSSPVKATPVDVFQLARSWYLAGHRVDMRQLSSDLQVSRATLYRWCGSRESLLGEVIWSVTEAALPSVKAGTDEVGRSYIIGAVREALTRIHSAKALRRLVTDDPEYALRLLTTQRSIVQKGLIEWCTALITENIALRAGVEADDLAYAIVRVSAGFTWSDMITGEPADAEGAIKVIDLLLAGAEDTKQRTGVLAKDE